MYPILQLFLCVNTYFDTICVHPIKSAYSLLKCVQLNSPINWNLSVNAVVFKISIFFYELKSDLFQNMLASCI